MTIDRKLTMLACSGSILATTLFGMPSEALPAPSLNSRAPQLAAAPLSRLKSTRSIHTEEMPMHKSYEKSDRQGVTRLLGSPRNLKSQLKRKHSPLIFT